MDYALHYYDLVLGGILASLLTGVSLGWLTSLPVAATLPAAALVAVAIIGHGLFVNRPVDRPEDLGQEARVLD